jgi:hypothetical protein
LLLKTGALLIRGLLHISGDGDIDDRWPNLFSEIAETGLFDDRRKPQGGCIGTRLGPCEASARDDRGGEKRGGEHSFAPARYLACVARHNVVLLLPLADFLGGMPVESA